MSMLALIILIPIFCIGLVMYFMTLYNYAILNTLDVPLLTIGILIVITFSFFIIKLFYKNLPRTAKTLNSEQNSNIIYNIFTFLIMLLFGIAIFIKSLNNSFDIFDFVIGFLIITFSLYIISNYFISYEEAILRLKEIETIDDKISCLKFEHEKYGEFEYYTNETDFKIERLYKIKINKKTRVIRTVINMVHNIE